MPVSRRMFVVALVFVCSVVSVLAQTVTGTLQGTVTGPDGAPLPGVTVTVRNLDTGTERNTVTNERGFYSAPFLPIGRYRVTASLEGLGSATREDVDVSLNQTTVQNVVLRSAISETLTVTGEAVHIDQTDGEIKGTLTADQIMAKPVANQASFLALADVFPGFQENPSAGQNNPTLSSGSSINFNGTGTRGATFQIDGVSNDDASENQHRQGISLAAIKQFQVITNNFSAEFGRGYGAVVLVETKSGTNAVDGELHEYHTDQKLTDKSYFARTSPKPVFHRDEWGGVAGFPIVRDSMFGFVSYDRTHRIGQLSYARDMFLPGELSAPFLTRNNDTPENRAFLNRVLGLFPVNPPNNDARSNRTYATVIDSDQPATDASARYDWNMSARGVLTARYQKSHQIFQAADVILGEQTRQNNRQSNLGVTWTHIFGANSVGEARYGLGIRSTNVDIAAGDDTPIIRFTGSPVSGPIIGNAGTFPINRSQRDNQFVYNFSSVLFTSHTLKAGTDIRRSELDDRAENSNRGFWNFRAACGGKTYSSPYAAFLDGCVNTFQKGYGPSYLENRIDEQNVYAEDQWHARPGFNVTIGGRFEHVDAPKELENRIDYGFKGSSYVDPRLGFAFVPHSDNALLHWLTGDGGRSSIRGGYGVFHGRVFQSIFSQNGANVRFNPPYGAFLTITNATNLADPTNGFVFTPGVEPTTRVNLTVIDPNLKMPETRQWNLTYERQVLKTGRVRVSYTGNEGRNLLFYSLDNLPRSPLDGPIVVPNHPFNAPAAGFPDLRGQTIDRIAADWQCAGTGFFPGITVNATCPNPVPLAPNEISLRVPRTNERRPDPRYGTNLVVSNAAQSWYNGVQSEWISGPTRGLSTDLAYTFSKTFDTGSEATATGTGDTNILGTNRRFARGLSRFDTRHRVTMFLTYDLPFLRDRHDFLGAVLGGWHISTVMKYASGNPFTVVDSGAVDFNFDGFAENRPVLVDPSVQGRHIDDPNTSQQKLPREAFRSVHPGDSIDMLVGRNTFYTDGTKNVDLSLFKSIHLPLRNDIVLRIDVFNVFNHTQWGFPVNDIANANFGKILITANGYAPRSAQLSVRYLF
jgi:hypothetical protein